ncbi:ABC transporter ATP-binding protein [Streptomyces indicus]|uniref:Simple sugar transport system ATP-binding protein n=1 Tax=Streptomyces indicus TaxID=417292 RepID=A0A1G8UA42_9ACTN|nr:ABC transporter ATP-binding protein [Streptomyces indicus]SDJ50603.1 simple sugar transport system ATP-binding protein [Streptomyces indicus]
MTAALEVSGLAKSYGGTVALDGVDLVVEAGTVHCVLGENGAGKSTLCHAVAGSLTPDAGTLRLYGQPYAPRRPADALAAGVAMVHQHFSLVSTLTVGENLRLLRLPGLAARIARVRETYGLELEPDAVVGQLPVGVRQRVEIVKALLRDPRLLVLDEPTGVLGPAETDALLETCRRIADAGHAVVLVTHKLGEAVRAGDAATVLRGGRVAGDGTTKDLSARRLVPLMIGRAAGDLDATLAGAVGLEDPEAVGPDAPGPDGLDDPGVLGLDDPAAVGLDDPAVVGPDPVVPGEVVPAAGPVRADDARTPQGAALRLREVTVRRADGAYALEDATLDVAFGEIVGVAGVEGNGQSELTAVLGGSLTPERGRVELDGRELTRALPAARTRAGLGVVPEDRHHEGCVPALSVAENLHLGRLREFRRFGVFLDRAALGRATEAALAEHDVRASGPFAPMASLSGGNQQKVVLARELALDPLKCLVAAQPTRGLDIGAVAAVHARIRAAAGRGAGVLVVSAELDELLTLCDRVVVAYRGRLLGPVDPRAADARERIGALMVGVEGERGAASGVGVGAGA